MPLILHIVLLALVLLTGCGGGGSSTESPTDTSIDTPADDGSVDDGSSDDTSGTDDTDSGDVVDVDDEGNTTVNLTDLATQLEALPLGEINDAELAGLLLMREEEKLAHDVYTALFDIHGLKIFDNIANSESSHTEAMLSLLDRYGIADPVGSNGVGVFSDIDLQMLYDTLVAQGTPSLMDALFVGARIEELDIADIQRLSDEVVDNDDIVLVYDNLLMGSRNHLRAFDRQITNNGWTYTPEHISQEAYDEIVSSEIERGGSGG